MGCVWVEARLVNSINSAELKTLVLVNTGATYTVVPCGVYEKLNFVIVDKKMLG
jgi:predicted aspartyl protease